MGIPGLPPWAVSDSPPAPLADTRVDPPLIQGMSDGHIVVFPMNWAAGWGQGYTGPSPWDDATQINLAMQQVQANLASAFPLPETVRLVAGAIYTIRSQVTWTYGSWFELNGAILQQVGSAPFSTVYMHGGNSPYPNAMPMGGISGGVIDGTFAAAGAVGLDVGDGSDCQIDRVRIANFGGAGSIGLWMVNRAGFFEKYWVRVQLYQNTIHCQIDNLGGAAQSHMYGWFDAHINAQDGQIGCRFANGAFVQNNGYFGLHGNCYSVASGTTNTPFLQFNGPGDGTGGNWGHISQTLLGIQMETDFTPSSPSTWQTIVFGDSNPAHDRILGCSGQLNFLGPNWVNSNVSPGQLTGSYQVAGDGNLGSGAGVFNAPAGINTGSSPAVSTPAVPTSGAGTRTNNTGTDVVAYITGGTSVAVTINGVATGMTSPCTVIIPAGQTCGFGSYTGSPSWVWTPL